MSAAAESRLIEISKNIIRMTTAAGSGHPSSALSLVHIVSDLLFRQMRWDPNDPWNPGNDRLVLSEGHSVPVVYATYAELGGVVGKSKAQARNLKVEDLKTLRELDSVLDGHPNPAEGFPFFDAATGSLGQGLSVGAGLALAARLGGIDKRVFVIIGDGESREGQIWEALDFIMDHNLTHVAPIFNCNGQGQADYVSRQQSADVLARKLAAYGFDVQVVDGHSFEELDAALGKVGKGATPVAVVARTQKGWGVESLKDKSNHGKPLEGPAVAEAEASLDRTARELKITAGPAAPRPPSPPAAKWPSGAATIQAMPFEEACAKCGVADAVAKNKISTRRMYGVALTALGHADERIVAVDGDVSNSTFAIQFAKAFPKRFFECKIAEQNMISVAAGLSAGGYIPFASTFAKFLARGYDQIEMAAITRANIKLVGSHAGVSLGADGPSQMSLPDIAYFGSYAASDDGRGNPACTVFHPADAVAAYHLTVMAANTTGLCYVRTHRPDVALLYKPDAKFEVGGSGVLAEGTALTVVASGYMTTVALKAVRELEKAGIKCTLIDAYSLPLKTEPVLAAARKAGGKILVVEDNFSGGINAAIALAAAQKGDVKVFSMTCPRIPKSGKTGDIILESLGLGVKDVEARIKSLA
jgi:transketolase